MIAFVLTHNLSDEENAAQIVALRSLLTEVIVPLMDAGKPVLDEKGNEIPTFSHWEFEGQVATVYQIIPFQPDNKSDPYEAIKPEGFDSLRSYNVMYGKGDEDKVGNHPRFYNWALKRCGDHGNKITVHIDDYKSLDASVIDQQIKSSQDFVKDAAVTVSKIGRVAMKPEPTVLSVGVSVGKT